MGLEATVRCRCFEEGKLTPFPLPSGDLYIDDEECLASCTLNHAQAKYEHDQEAFDRCFGDLQLAFEQWVDHACEHERGEYLREQVCGRAGIDEFAERMERLGGAAKFPLLARMLPRENDGVYAADLAKPTLKELDRFIEKSLARGEGKYPTAERIRNLLIASLETGNPIRWC